MHLEKHFKTSFAKQLSFKRWAFQWKWTVKCCASTETTETKYILGRNKAQWTKRTVQVACGYVTYKVKVMSDVVSFRLQCFY